MGRKGTKVKQKKNKSKTKRKKIATCIFKPNINLIKYKWLKNSNEKATIIRLYLKARPIYVLPTRNTSNIKT